MAYDFPATPIDGQEFTPVGGPTYVFQTPVWLLKQSTATIGLIISDTPPPSPVHEMQWWQSNTGNLYVYYEDVDGGQWVQTNTTKAAQPIVDAPSDGIEYARQDAAWSPLVQVSGVWELIETGEYRDVALWERLDLGAFRSLHLIYFIRPSAVNTGVMMRVSVDAGATWEQGAASYYLGMRWNGIASNALAQSSANYTYLFFYNGTYYGTNPANHGGGLLNLNMEDFNKPRAMHYVGKCYWINNDGSGANMPHVGGYASGLVPRNGIRIYPLNALNFAYVRLSLLGIRG